MAHSKEFEDFMQKHSVSELFVFSANSEDQIVQGIRNWYGDGKRLSDKQTWKMGFAAFVECNKKKKKA